MKTILVFTDFSINADYVAQYALRFAQNIGANILLCNAFEVPAAEATTGAERWQMLAYEQNSINDLGAQVAALKSRMDAEISGDGFRPEITQYSQLGGLNNILNELAGVKDILMGVISEHSADRLSEYFADNHTWDIVDNANFPVMVIPYQARFTPFRMIAFATAMNYTDINILQSLTGLAAYSNAEILVANITTDQKEEVGMEKFFNQIPGKINYSKIIYQTIDAKDIAMGIKKLGAHTDVDLVVVVHQKLNLLQSVFNKSITKKIADRPNKPVLIFPGFAVKETLTVF
jgi:nucleotide-binding universal stress UspA family protein